MVGPDSAYLSTEEIVLNVKNRILLSGLMSDSLTMESGKEYLIVDNFVMGTNTHLEIEPGVRVYFSDNKSMQIFGTLKAEGTPENRIKFLPENVYWDAVIVLGNQSASFLNCDFVLAEKACDGAELHFEDCSWFDCGGSISNLSYQGTAKSCNVTEWLGYGSTFSFGYYWQFGTSEGINIVNNSGANPGLPVWGSDWGDLGLRNSNVFNNWLNVPSLVTPFL